MAATEPGSAGAATLKPGEVIRPHVSQQVVKDLVKNIFGLNVLKFKELNSYDDKNFFVEVSDEFSNPHISAVAKGGYVLKVLNSLDSKKMPYVDGQNQMMRFLGGRGFQCPQPVPSRAGKLFTLEKIYRQGTDGWQENNLEERPHGVHVVRLLTFLPGNILYEVPYTGEIFYQMGNYVARMDKALEEFEHPAYENHSTIWSLASVPKLRDFVYAVRDEGHRALVLDVVTAFEEKVPPQYPNLKKYMIHGDFNEQNIIVRPREGEAPGGGEEKYDVCGVIDFGDTQKSYRIFEVAMTITYGMLECKKMDIFDVGGHVLAGYTSDVPLSDLEMGLLKECVAGRYIQSLAMGEYTYWEVDPGNDYLLTTAKNGWTQLERLWSTPTDQLLARWNSIIQDYRNRKL